MKERGKEKEGEVTWKDIGGREVGGRDGKERRERRKERGERKGRSTKERNI